MELRQLRYFVAVADHLHFGRAAAWIGMEQSPLSRAIKAFEIELGVKLFATSTRRTDLTTAGTVLLQDARRILAATEQTKARMSSFSATTATEIILGVCEGALDARLARLLSRFRETSPFNQIRLRELSFAHQLTVRTSSRGPSI